MFISINKCNFIIIYKIHFSSIWITINELKKKSRYLLRICIYKTNCLIYTNCLTVFCEQFKSVKCQITTFSISSSIKKASFMRKPDIYTHYRKVRRYWGKLPSSSVLNLGVFVNKLVCNYVHQSIY